jgi:excisionase family DNA binding protein
MTVSMSTVIDAVKEKLTMRTEGKISPRKASRMLGVSLHFVYQLLWEGKLVGSQKIGKRWHIPVAAVEARLRSQQ